MQNNLPPNWSWVKLGDEFNINMGQSPPSSTYNENGVGLPFFQGKTEFTDLHPIPKKWCSEPKKIAEKNDILISVRAPVGSTNVANQKCCIGRGLAAIRYPDCPRYIFYFLRSIENKLDELGTGTTFKAISASTLKNIPIPLPPLPEQRRIVEKIEELFSELDNGIENLKKAKEQIKTYRQAVLKFAFEGKLVQGQRIKDKGKSEDGELREGLPSEVSTKAGWKWVKLGEATSINPKLPFDKIQDSIIVSFLPMRQVEELNGKFDLSLERNYSEVKKGFTPFTNGDVIFAKITPCMENGKIAVVNNLKNKIGFGSTEFHVFRTKEKLFNHFLFYFLIQDSFRAQAQHNMTGAVGQKRVPKRFLEDFEIPLPPLTEQIQIVSEIEKRFSVADKMEAAIDESLNKAGTLRQSILKQAFEGKLVS